MLSGKLLIFYILFGADLIWSSESDDDANLFVDLTVDLENWMRKLPKRLKAVPLKDMAIPGSHDSFTSGISSHSDISPDNKDLPKILGKLPSALVVARWAKCQELNVTGQLMAGIRYFDARFCRNDENNKIYFCHGMYSDEVTEVFNAMESFLSSHPQEVVIIDSQHFYEMYDDIHRTLIKQMVGIFGTKLAPFVRHMDLITLDYLTSKNQQVIVVYRNWLASDQKQFWPESRIRSKWYETMDTKKLIASLNDGLKDRSRNKMHVSQCILSPAVKDVVKGIFSSLKQKAAVDFEVKRIRWIEAQTPGRKGVNIIINDFIELSDNLFSKTVINLNRKLADTIYENGVTNMTEWFKREVSAFSFTWIQ